MVSTTSRLKVDSGQKEPLDYWRGAASEDVVELDALRSLIKLVRCDRSLTGGHVVAELTANSEDKVYLRYEYQFFVVRRGCLDVRKPQVMVASHEGSCVEKWEQRMDELQVAVHVVISIAAKWQDGIVIAPFTLNIEWYQHSCSGTIA